MKRLRKFLLLPAADWYLSLSAALLLGTIALGLHLLPFRTVRRLLVRQSRRVPALPEADPTSLARVVRATTVASRYLLGAGSCLPQALAAQILLVRRGHPACLRIGIAKDLNGRLQAHAWVESQGMVVIGGGALSRYTPLPAFIGEPRGDCYGLREEHRG
jgi:hypothetical protein